MKKTRQYFLVSVFLSALIFLSIYFIVGNQRDYSYRVPEQTNDGWATVSLTDIGMDTEPLIKLMNGLSRRNVNHVHSILVIKDNKLVFEEYFSGEDLDLTNNQLNFVHKDFDHNTLHCQASASKSITSILLGITIDQGLVQDVQQNMFSFFPEHSDLNDTEKGKITLEHMLTMSSGIPWDESYPYTDPRNDLNQMFYSADPIKFVLEKSVVAPPGSLFTYNSGTTNLLGDVVRRSTGLTLVDFAEQYLFTPLGINSFNWIGFPNAPHIAIASSTLYLRPRDMAKIGQLYLQKGIWNGNRIVSENWVTESTHESIQVPPSKNPIPGFIESYGYQWWQGTFSNGNTETYFAAGWGGQFIYVIPEINMVIVVTAGDFEGQGYQGFYNLINDYILAAAYSGSS
ncbi:MAG: serine hydrolase [Candidatus Bathyarchaeota archaeon]|nr:MAG: serine hydrolase [Candidatus Bathyarchaeota archaeon]